MAVGSGLPKPSTCAAMYTVERSSQNESLFGKFRIPQFCPGSGRLGKGGGVVEQGIRTPGERHAINLAVFLDQLLRGEGWRKLRIVGNLGQIELGYQAGAAKHRGHVAGGRDHIVIGGGSPAQLSHQLIAGSHVRRAYFALALGFEALHERRVGITLPHQQAQRRRRLLASAKNGECSQAAQ